MSQKIAEFCTENGIKWFQIGIIIKNIDGKY